MGRLSVDTSSDHLPRHPLGHQQGAAPPWGETTVTRPPTILVPIDFSGLGDATLAVARQQAQALDAQLHLLHVLDLRPMRPLGIDSVPALDLQDELQEDLRRRLRSVADETTDRLHLEQREAQLHQAAPSAVRSSVRLLVESSLRIGDPAEEILACARELEPRLIVMGTHGRRGLARLWLGSTTEEVLRRASCPVLSVHPTEGPSTSEQPPVLSLEVEHLLPGLRRALRVRDCVRRDAPRVPVNLPAREVLQRLALHDGLPLAVVDAAGEWLGTIHEAFILERLLLWEGRDLSQAGLTTVERLLELQRHLGEDPGTGRLEVEEAHSGGAAEALGEPVGEVVHGGDEVGLQGARLGDEGGHTGDFTADVAQHEAEERCAGPLARRDGRRQVCQVCARGRDAGHGRRSRGGRERLREDGGDVGA